MKQLVQILIILFSGTAVFGQFLEKKKNLDKREGYFNFYYNEDEGEIYLEVKETEKEFLYVSSLSSGVGSNDIGLDRGQLGGERVVYFKRSGDKLLLIQPNLEYRANSDNKLERNAVEQAFAKSVLYGFDIKEKKDDGTFIIDLTPFIMQDAHGVAQKLKSTDQGTYKLDKSKSALWMDRTKAFPKNVEFEALLTFEGEPKGRYIRSVTPDASLVSVVEHHSFIELPDDIFEMRKYDPRSGLFQFSFMDYATPVNEQIVKRFISRHRLEKKDPDAAVSEAVAPIIYYLDNGTPEPIRSALLDGARWWNQAFEAIGYKDAFQVKMLPDDADPMDVRYNVIQWVHRSTRGWSYGSSVADPRTGEIIKGHVSLGSLRIRQDYLIAQALMNRPFNEKNQENDPMLEIALARIRQLAAHEVGHTLGFSHNFAASTNNRASVMDYPHPLYTLSGNSIDFSEVYDTKIGEWDKFIVAYAYGDMKTGQDEDTYLNEVLENAAKKGLRFISDRDARAAGGAHPYAHLWDNGSNAADELEDVLEVRAKAIINFSEDNIKDGEPYSVLEDVFVPLYYYHRYQTEATIKVVGGLDYSYAVKGGTSVVPNPVSPKEQKRALEVVLKTLDPEVLAIPKEKLALFPPRALGYNRSRESFQSKLDVAFDPLSAAETAADLTLSFLFNPSRASRMVSQQSLDNKQMGFDGMIDAVIGQTFKNIPKDSYDNEIQQLVNYRVLFHLMNLSKSTEVYPTVNAIANEKLDEIKAWLRGKGASVAHSNEYIRKIDQFREKPENFKVVPVSKIADGSPIGTDCSILN
ncbi:zinc-dependent metalloprotease [Robertkochia solimangrovi]|uniref:zinc-dependent metalloprotease n=1 Tax=Robertkochia solimangrovi TaxID=2213046 RepID=UPI0011809B6B|nr:zinc-dependent metalloprotease [Robertkochia solimangrovi]TRZ45364.1 peptidase [Robertkochia solimangrovi]